MPDNIPLVRVVTTIQYEKEIKKLQKKYRSIEDDLMPLIDNLRTGETPGDKISGNKYPVYKVRVKNSNINKGQSGGYRVIYYTMTADAVLLTAIYSKSVQENISNEEIETRIDRYKLQVEQQERENETAQPEDPESKEDR
jgi:mRNA-degrading endonuclease RelE of RelBE toxin-antitoxin system